MHQSAMTAEQKGKKRSTWHHCLTTEEYADIPVDQLPKCTIWKGFQEHTTAHGIPHIKNARGVVKTSFWTLVTFAALGGLVYNGSVLVSSFLAYKVSVKVELRYKKELTFPAVTVCNMNPIRIIGLHHILRTTGFKNNTPESNVTSDMFGLTTDKNLSIGGFKIQNFTSGPEAPTMTGNGDMNQDCPEAREDRKHRPRDEFAHQLKILSALASLNESVKHALGHQKESLILDCQYNGFSCEPGDFTSFYNNIYGNCYIFNSGWNSSNPVLTSYKPGPRFGLQLTLNIEQDLYVGDLTESAGVRVVVHGQERMPFPEDEGISVGPGRLTSLGIKKITVKRLGGVYGNCSKIKIDNAERNTFEEHYPVRYSNKACYKTCFQKHLMMTCGCSDLACPNSGKAFHGVSEEPCSPYNTTQAECVENVKTRYSLDLLPCDCPQACKEMTYASTVSSVKWPSDNSEDRVYEKLAKINNDTRRMVHDEADPKKPDRNLLKLEVFFQELNYERIKEEPAYQAGQFVSDLGGILGLYIGFSALTILEFLELFVDYIYWACAKCRSKARRDVRPATDGRKDRSCDQFESPPPPYDFPASRYRRCSLPEIA